MKLYDHTAAPNPRRARIFAAEKSIAIELVQVALHAREQFSAEFTRLNPANTVPVLQLDDGRTISENVGIARYLEEMQPEPPLLGRDAYEKAQVASWNGRIENDGLGAISECFRNSHQDFANRGVTGRLACEQIPALVQRGRARTRAFLQDLDGHLAQTDYICGGAFTLADISALVAIDFAGWIGITIESGQAHLRRWYAQVSTRPSAKA